MFFCFAEFNLVIICFNKENHKLVKFWLNSSRYGNWKIFLLWKLTVVFLIYRLYSVISEILCVKKTTIKVCYSSCIIFSAKTFLVNSFVVSLYRYWIVKINLHILTIINIAIGVSFYRLVGIKTAYIVIKMLKYCFILFDRLKFFWNGQN